MKALLITQWSHIKAARGVALLDIAIFRVTAGRGRKCVDSLQYDDTSVITSKGVVRDGYHSSIFCLHFYM